MRNYSIQAQDEAMVGSVSMQNHNDMRSQCNGTNHSHGGWNGSIWANHPARGHQRGRGEQSGGKANNHHERRCWYCKKQGHVQAHCPTNQADERNGNIQNTNYDACSIERHDQNSGEVLSREHDSALTVQHALNTNNDNQVEGSQTWYLWLMRIKPHNRLQGVVWAARKDGKTWLHRNEWLLGTILRQRSTIRNNTKTKKELVLKDED